MTLSVGTERQENLLACLRTLRGTYGKITPRQMGARHGWGDRSVMRYLNDLEAAGLAEPVTGLHSQSTSWRITQAGRNHLQGMTSATIGASLDLHPATQERDPL